MQNRIVPVGLKGREITERMINLMGITPINENRKNSVVELTKKGPDGKVYGIVRENHEYYIKTTNKTKNLVVEDFSYIGGLMNKKSEAYGSYAKAIKHLNLKFKSLNEAYGVSDNINVFEDDKLLKEDAASFYQQTGSGFSNEGNFESQTMSECCGAPVMEGMCSACGTPSVAGTPNEGMDMDNGENQRTHYDSKSDWGGEEPDEPYDPIQAAHAEYKSPIDRMYNTSHYVQAQRDAEGLDEFSQAVQDMMDEDEMNPEDKEFAGLAAPYDKITYADKIAGARMHENKLSIARAINQMDEIIDSVVTSKKKVYTLK